MTEKQKHKSRWWRLLTIYLRRFRTLVLFVSFVLLGAFFYLNQIGLPDFAKRPLLASLRERGVDLEFERMRLRWQRGIVADNVRFGAMREPSAPKLFAREVQIKVNRSALFKGDVDVEALRIRDGRVEWQAEGTNAPMQALNLSNVQTRLRLLPGDRWMLDDFRATFGGAKFQVSASITNASALRDMELFKREKESPEKPSAGMKWPERLRLVADALEHVKFTAPPDFNMDVEGDARQLESFAVKFAVIAQGADTPWGSGSNLLFTARLFPAVSNELSRAELQLEAERANTPWASATNVTLLLRLVSSVTQPDLAHADLSLRATDVFTPWAEVHGAVLDAGWVHAVTNPIPLTARVELGASTVRSRWADGNGLRVEATLSRVADTFAGDSGLGFWTNFTAYKTDCRVTLMQLRTEKISGDGLVVAASWSAPRLKLHSFHAGLARGSLQGRASLDVVSRRAEFALESGFDAKQLLPLMGDGAQRWLNRLEWKQPPQLSGNGSVTLPAWTDVSPDWEEVLSRTLVLSGQFALTNGAYRGVPADWATSHVTYSNFIWRLPDLAASSARGAVRLEHWTDDSTQDYYWRIRSTLHPEVLMPVLSDGQKRAFEIVKFADAPEVDAELWGRWRDESRIGFQGTVAVSNLVVRSERFESIAARVSYTNQMLRVFSPVAFAAGQSARADGLLLDFERDRLWFTNGFSTVPPFTITRAVGPITHRTMEPYVFVKPPTTRVNGFISLVGAEDVDVTFDIDGGPFEWWRFRVPQLRGRAHWMGTTLALTNMEMLFYEGWADGGAYFKFDAPVGTDFSFTINTTNSNLHQLIGDMYSPTNTLEGVLSGSLVVTRANSDAQNSWQGYGQAQLRDGLIWSIPVFGVLSKPMDNIVEGLGSARIKEAKARFTITDSVVQSSDLEMRTPASRLQYKGTVDFDGQINARVEAELFRDTWLIGRMVSFVLWPITKMFEFKVTGPLNEPKLDPVYLPNLTPAPKRKIGSLEELLPPPVIQTNAPPAETPLFAPPD